MKKIYYIFIFLLLFSCSTDEFNPIVDEPTPTNSMIFDKENNIVTNEMELTFNIPVDGIYYLVITQTNSVVSKEKFKATLGINKRIIYTKSLLKGKYELTLQSEDKKEIDKTNININ